MAGNNGNLKASNDDFREQSLSHSEKIGDVDSTANTKSQLEEEDISDKHDSQTHSKNENTGKSIELDAGDLKVRIRGRWWQFWLPKNLPPPPPETLNDVPVIPVSTASIFSQWTFTWINPIMVLGYQRTLQASDLWKMDHSQESGYLSEQLDAAWARRAEAANEWNIKLTSGELKPGILKRILWQIQATLKLGSTVKGSRRERIEELEIQWREIDGRKEPSLAWSVNDVFGNMFWIAGIYKVFSDTGQTMSPLLAKAIINFAEERTSAKENGSLTPNVGRGIGMAIGLGVIVVFASLTQHQFFWRSMITGVLTRGALINSIYKRSVVLNAKSRVKHPNANLINHISTDVSRIDAAAQWFHCGWTAPIQVLVCLIILLVQLWRERIMAHRLKTRKTTNRFTEQRAKLLAESLGVMRVVKYFSYEGPFLDRITGMRRNELQGVRWMNHMQSVNVAFAYSVPVLAATLSFVTYAHTSGGQFNAAVIFSSLSLFQLLRQPMMFLPRAMSVTTDAQNAFSRLSKLFHAEILHDIPFVIDHGQDLALDVTDASFEWEVIATPDANDEDTEDSKKASLQREFLSSADPFRVRGVDMKVQRGCLVAIVGRVGSGKSSLLQGLVGEMRKTSGDFSFGGRVAYCPQIAWIQNASLRDNILFGQPFEEVKYWRALERSCLIPDLQMLPDGDLTEIGEKGINLSGGQRQRVNIARALYYNADVILFDDPLSAVDAHVGRSLFHGAIHPLVKEGKTVILVTHALHFLSNCDYIYTMDAGKIAEHGSYVNLISCNGEFARLDKEFGGELAPETRTQLVNAAAVEAMQSKANRVERQGAGVGRLEGKLIVKERRTTGSLSWAVYKTYLIAGMGWFTIPSIALSILLMQGSQIVNSYTLVWWEGNQFGWSFPLYELLYAVLGIFQAMFTVVLGLAIDMMSTFASKNLHNDGTRAVMYAPMSFFDTTPMGRVQSVFGKDVDNLDIQLPTSMKMTVLLMANVVGSVIIISILEPFFLIAVFVIAFGYQYFASFYRASAREVKRLDAMLRSLLYSHFSESLTGLPTIRSYGEIPRFVRDNKFYIDLENRALFLTVTNQRWLAVRLDALGAFLVFFIAIFSVIGVGGINAAEIGLVLTYATQLTQLLGRMTRQSAELENYMNSVERIAHYSHAGYIDQEAPHEIPNHKPPQEWPDRGAIRFNDVCMSYRPGLPNVLHNVNLSIDAGEKIGIVGRTGAGKSSLTLCLLRIVEFSGLIKIDDVNISEIGLKDLRTKIAIIPQDPILFSGTVRSTLDPFSVYDDVRLWDALRRSFLIEDRQSDDSATDIDESSNGYITLDTVIEPEGTNLSLGQRSLLSLARALVKDSRVVILDEATASVDLQTDKRIQDTIRSEFQDRTLLCIAHRLRTIIGYDRILVMDAGRVVEFDSPLALFQRDDSIFRGFWVYCSHLNMSTEPCSKLRRVYDSLPPEAQKILVDKHLSKLLKLLPKEKAKNVVSAATRLQTKYCHIPNLDLKGKKKEIRSLLNDLRRDSKRAFLKEQSNRVEILSEIVESLTSWIADIWKLVYEHKVFFSLAHSALLYVCEVIVELGCTGGCKCAMDSIPVYLSIKIDYDDDDDDDDYFWDSTGSDDESEEDDFGDSCDEDGGRCTCELHARHWPSAINDQRIHVRELVVERLCNLFELEPSPALYLAILAVSDQPGKTTAELMKTVSRIATNSSSTFAAALAIYAIECEALKISKLLDTHSHLLRSQDVKPYQAAVIVLIQETKYRSRAIKIIEKELQETVHSLRLLVQSSFCGLKVESNKTELRRILKLQMASQPRIDRVNNWVDAVITPSSALIHPVAFAAAMVMGFPPGLEDGDDNDVMSYLDLDPDDPDLEDLREEFRPQLRDRFDGWMAEEMPFLSTADVTQEMLNRLAERPTKEYVLDALEGLSEFAKMQRKKKAVLPPVLVLDRSLRSRSRSHRRRPFLLLVHMADWMTLTEAICSEWFTYIR
ncbi:ABC protein [Lentinula edodes]|uniref:ABC protein n=1 Tax=Lentinula edodes TaxID=5353 RepID=A0A1Q3EE32_LENED|nr:ABC protein [Lentinula edodes]